MTTEGPAAIQTAAGRRAGSRHPRQAYGEAARLGYAAREHDRGKSAMKRNAYLGQLQDGPLPSGRNAGPRLTRNVPLLAGGTLRPLALLGLALPLWVACSEPPRGNLKYIEPEQYSIDNPSRDRALATGIGCGFNPKDAEAKAQETAAFNLRRLTGEAHYRIEFTRLRDVPDPRQACVELQARAIPYRLR